MYTNYLDAEKAAMKHNNTREAWEREEDIPVYNTKSGEWEVFPVVGSYGTFGNPVVLAEDTELVTHAGWLNPDTGVVTDRCQGSAACGSCDGTCGGCRFDERFHSCQEVWYI